MVLFSCLVVPVEALAVNQARLAPQRQIEQMQIASFEGARMCIRPSERFSFSACFGGGRIRDTPSLRCLGHERNKAEVKAAEFSAPIAIFVVVRCAAQLV